MQAILAVLTRSAIFRSIVRHGLADTNRNRSLLIFENLFLHVHPVKVREKALRLRHTYWLGGVTTIRIKPKAMSALAPYLAPCGDDADGSRPARARRATT